MLEWEDLTPLLINKIIEEKRGTFKIAFPDWQDWSQPRWYGVWTWFKNTYGWY